MCSFMIVIVARQNDVCSQASSVLIQFLRTECDAASRICLNQIWTSKSAKRNDHKCLDVKRVIRQANNTVMMLNDENVCTFTRKMN